MKTARIKLYSPDEYIYAVAHIRSSNLPVQIMDNSGRRVTCVMVAYHPEIMAVSVLIPNEQST